MSPSRSRRSNSRRSSILKPSKPRQALQNLNVNSSSSENSPATTSKFKRRVSFAEKKHVKEFCNSVEQGTVWDTTYEEHDLSNLKVPDTFNQEECNVNIVQKENIVVFNEENNVICNHKNNLQLIYQEMTEKDLNVNDSNVHNINVTDGIKSNDSLLSQTKMLISSSVINSHDVHTPSNVPLCSTKLQLKSDNNVSKTTIACKNYDENLSDNISELSQLNFNNFNSNNVHPISIQDVRMDFTEVICHAMYHDTNYVQNNKLEKTLQNMSMELTQPISSCVNVLQNCQQEQDIEKFNSVCQLDKSKAVADQCTSMSMTIAVPSSVISDTADQVNWSTCSPNNRTKRFDNISMEITTPVRSVLSTLQQSANNNGLEACGSGLMAYIDNKTTPFHDTSMEITNVVKTKTNRLMDCQLEECDRLIASEERNFQCDNEKTKLLNISMEMTTAFPRNIHSITESREKKVVNCKIKNIFIENNLETVMSDIHCCKPLVDLGRTKICDNELMEFTEVIATWPKDNLTTNELIQNANDGKDDNINLILNNLENEQSDVDHYKVPVSINQTKMCDNEGMEFTEAITIAPKINLTNSELVQDLMTSTEMVSSSNIKDNFKKITEDHESNSNNQDMIQTPLCSNMSMEITEAVMMLQSHLPTKNPVINGTCIKELVLIETIENEDKDTINSTAINDNVVKDLEVSVPLNSSLILNREMHITDNFPQRLERNTMETPILTEIENDVNITNMVSSESEQADIDISTSKVIGTPTVDLLKSGQQDMDVPNVSKENVREKTYVLSPMLNEPSGTVTSEINQNDRLPHKQLQTVMSNPRRTYVIQPLSIDHYCNKDDSKTSDNINNEIKNDVFCYTSNDKTNCAHNSVNDIASLKDFENNDIDYLIEQDVIFCNNTVEELNTITPPSFVCLDDSLDLGTSVDVRKEVSNISHTNEFEHISESKYNFENVSDIHKTMLKADQVAIVQIDQLNGNCSNNDLRPTLKLHDCFEESVMTTELDPFDSLVNKLKVCAESDQIIWEVYHENIERNLFVIGFISSSLLVIIYLKDHCDAIDDQSIKEIKIYSRLTDDADALISMVHRVILERLDTQELTDLCKSSEDIFTLLNYISKEVKLVMDFMFDVERIRDITLMEISTDSISFIAFGKKKDIILRVTVDIKPFHKIESNDISVHCKLGSVREEDVKRLIKNIKRDHKFLRRFINDVNDYIYLMEESVNIIKR